MHVRLLSERLQVNMKSVTKATCGQDWRRAVWIAQGRHKLVEARASVWVEDGFGVHQ
jgi:hypothetical protein